MRSPIRIIAAILLILFFSPSGIVYSQEDTKDKALSISQILFHKSSNWKEFGSFPLLDKEKIKKYESSMRLLFMKSKKLDQVPYKDCSFTEIIKKGKLHFFDINGDGNNDIVYSGVNFCAEEYLTVIWLGSKNGLDQSAAIIQSLEILRVEPSGSSQITSADLGCCADPTDQYFHGDIIRPFKIRHKVVKDMELPVKLEMVSYSFKAHKETIIRSAPVTINAYDRDRSEYVGCAVLGNIVAKYLQGAKGEIVATYRDSSGVKWGLIIFDSSSEVYKLYDPYGANVGWTIIR